MPPEPPAPDPTVVAGPASRLVAIDALRLAAAVGVLVYHFTARRSSAWGQDQDALIAPAVAAWASYGSLGPELFFVISGFVILMTAWGRTTAAVVASRIGRLYPSYWVAVLLTGFLLLVVWPEGKEVTVGQVAVNLTMLQSLVGVEHVDGVYWTLWTELRFYLLVGVLVLVGVTRRRVLAVALVWPVLALLVERAGADDLAHLLVSDYAPLFAAGMALYVLRREGHAVLPWLVVAVNTALAVAIRVPPTVSGLERVTGVSPSHVGLGIALASCVVLVALAAFVPLPALDRPWVVAAAALTYPVYLVHQYWGLWVISLVVDHVPAAVAVLAAVAASFALAWCVHRAVEAPYAPALRRRTERALTRARDRLLDRVNAGPRVLDAAEATPPGPHPPVPAAGSRPGST
ncbi:acyltransferase family protein [Cellulomonas sp. S1-8]|uniref:acyltransferase family protein n=1 Tax=Cellulomonas sp. S1-8 TaxID=2904790 RepID=UPI002243D687|nr:acyltransferase [Cellulomonas sp. S1-8]UZN01946.1 acyltransferase [Cellulomonas sp. S1-8]